MFKKMYFKVISVVVMILLILNFIPFSIYAELSNIQEEQNTISENVDENNVSTNELEETNNTDKNETTQNSANQVYFTDEGANSSDASTNESEDNNTKVSSEEIKEELVDKREENVKYFLLNDKTVKAEIYQEPVHYMKDGKWEDINNSLAETNDEDDGQKVDQNISNSFKVKFAKKAKDNKLVTIKNDVLKLKWSLVGANKVSMKKINDNQANEEKDPTILKNVSSGVIYSDIMKDMDIEYVVKSQEVKENIILKTQKATENKLIFNLDIGDLEAKLNQDNTISIYNENNEEISRIDAPYMYDSNQEFSSEVNVTLTKEKKNYTVEIKPDEEWINSPERVYPITIDPTVQTLLYYQDIQDTFIHPGDSTNDSYDRYHAHILRVGNRKGEIYRSIIKFKLPDIKAGDQVIDAKLNLCDYGKTDEWTPPTQSRQIDVYKMAENATDNLEGNATWDNLLNKNDSAITDYNMYQFDYNNQGKSNTWDVTSIVKDWYVTGNNYGLMLKEHNEDQYSDQSDAYYFSANTNVTYIDYRPAITIQYRNQSGLEDYWSFHTQDAGRAGTSHVNDYNGNLVLTNGDVQTPGNRMPLGIYHVYNSNDCYKDIGMGRGWRLNISQFIEKVNIGGIEYARYTDEDGTQHYFAKIDDKYVDEDGLGLKLTQNPDLTFTIVDKSGNKLIFERKLINNQNELWNLQQIIDTNDNKTTITYSSANNLFYIQKVTDSAGSVVNFNWNGYGRIESIVDQNGDTIQYVYDSQTDFNLVTIKYIDGNQVEYQYDDRHYMTRAKDVDTSAIYYYYKPGNPYRISSVQEQSSKDANGQRLIGNSLNFDYGSNSTVITNDKGYSNLLTFNNQGNLISTGDFGNNSFYR